MHCPHCSSTATSERSDRTAHELGKEILQRYPGLPVVLTSGYSHFLGEEGRHGFELLHKPYAVDYVSRVLRRSTRRRM